MELRSFVEINFHIVRKLFAKVLHSRCFTYLPGSAQQKRFVNFAFAPFCQFNVYIPVQIFHYSYVFGFQWQRCTFFYFRYRKIAEICTFRYRKTLVFCTFRYRKMPKKCSFRYRKHISNDFSNSLKVGYEGRNTVKTTKKTRYALALCILFITLPLQKATNMNQTSYFRLSTLLSLRTSGTRE